MSLTFDVWGVSIMAGVLLIGIIVGRLWGHKTAIAQFVNEQNRLQATRIWADSMKKFQDMEVQ